MSKNVVTVSEDTNISELSKILLENKISGVPVIDKEGRIKGIVTEADILKDNIKIQFPFYFDPLMGTGYAVDFEKYRTEAREYLQIEVREIMTKRVKTVMVDTPVNKIAEILSSSNINRIPVVDSENKVVGIITRADIIKSMF